MIVSGIGLALAGGLILAGGAMSASAETPPEGGDWHYGVREGGIYGSGGPVWSEYFYDSREHKTTACSRWDCARSDWIDPGQTAGAYRSPASFGGNKAFYDDR